MTKTDYTCSLLAYDYNSSTGAITLNTSMTVPNATNGDPRESREIALDADGNLFYSGYAGSGSDNVVMMLPDATNVAAWDEANVAVFFTSTEYTGYNGMDVAVSSSGPVGLLGDYNDDGTIDAADYTVWRDVLAAGGTELTNDPTPGTVDESDYAYWKANFGATSGSGALAAATVPEPSTLALVALAIGALVLGRGSRGAAANL